VRLLRSLARARDSFSKRLSEPRDVCRASVSDADPGRWRFTETPYKDSRPGEGAPSAVNFLLQEADRHWVAIEFSVARLDGGDDDEDRVQDPKDGQEKKADQDEAKNGGDHVVNEHGDLEVE